MAKERGLKVKLFATPQEFLSAVDNIDRITPIYVDVSLGGGVRGTDFAHVIHKLGFLEINLSTGYDSETVQAPPFISRIVGKEFPNIGQ